MRYLRKGKDRLKGFTLIELMIVIAIIAILASIAIPQYMKYQKKAKVTSYVLPVVRACLQDAVAYCIDHDSAPSDGDLQNCGEVNTPLGTIDPSLSGTTCTNGTLTAGTASYTYSGYTVNCTIENNATKCTIEY